MTTRRDFLKQSFLAGAGGSFLLSESLRRALAIDPEPGSTFMDAEHVVILMQENRSFDHLYGTLRGVRGFDDPRAIELPDGNPVWLQTNKRRETFAPFRLDIKETKITWLGSLPHSWTDQTDARNQGKCDGWLEAKRSEHKECAGMPLTMGSYTREDVPFYYDLADAFTICDQHFCSSLTGTMPNRLYLWSGTVRGVKDSSARARVNNSDVEYEDSCAWKTFPDRLEKLGVSWKVYQNEISSVDVGFDAEEAAWLANFGDNPLEWFPQFHTGFFAAHQKRLEALITTLPAEIDRLRKEMISNPDSTTAKAKLDKAEAALRAVRERRAKFNPEKFAAVSQRAKNLHEKALDTNLHDPHYHELTTLRYEDGGVQREMKIPKGDVLHQFRQDVANGKLPTVSWIVAPENFSDHPGAAWFGAWYVSEVLNILTQNPEVWRKTVFLLTYDENDGYFDHVPPFVAPHPRKAETGVARGIKTDEDFVTMEEELRVKRRDQARESSIGLGYRVPLVVASPWSRGGYVCSQVFDHTSALQFLEKLLSKKMGKPVQEPNISDWRRTVCGDLTSCFRPYNGEKISLPPFLKKEPFVESIHKAQYKPLPAGFKVLGKTQIQQIRERAADRPMLRQEPGIRPACALPYELAADGVMNPATQSFEITFAAKSRQFGENAAGAPFVVYAPGNHKSLADENGWENCRSWNFAVPPGTELTYSWKSRDFENGVIHLRVYGPNGFFREFRSDENPPAKVRVEYRGQYRLALVLTNTFSHEPSVLEIVDNAYGSARRLETIATGTEHEVIVDSTAVRGWYDVTIRSVHNSLFLSRFAGRIETGDESISDPVMGRG